MKFFPTRTLGALLSLGTLAAAQAPMARPTAEIDTTSTGNAFFFSIATEEETSAIVFADDGPTGQHVVYASLSDGRGVDWSAPIPLSNDPTNAIKTTGQSSCRIVNGTIYAVWIDQRVGNGTEDLYLNVSPDGGNSWVGEVRLPKPFPNLGNLHGIFDFEVVPGTGGAPDTLYFLFGWDPGAGFSDAYLVKSTDGGQTFAFPTPVSQGAVAPSRVSKLDLEVVDDTVHVAWYDSVGSTFPTVPAFRTHYQRSLDGGTTWLPTDERLTDDFFDEGNFYDRMGLEVDGDRVAVFWQAIELFNTAQNGAVHVRVSEDGGDTFGPDEIVGGYVPNHTDIDRVSMAISEGHVLMAWNDNRSGNDELYVQRREDGSTTWVETQLTNGPRPGGGFGAELVFVGDEGALIGGGPGLPNAAVASTTHDGGATWSSLVEVSDHPTLDLIIFVDGVYNARYDNVLMAWNVEDPMTGERSLRAGGFRNQTVRASGFDGLAGTASFEYSGFRPGVDTFAFMAFSFTPGDFLLPYPSQRNTGLALDALLLSSLNSLFLSTSTALGPDGSGSSRGLVYSFPTPVSFQAVGIGLDFTPGEVVGRMTDAFTIDVQ